MFKCGNLIAYLKFTSMNYPGFRFSKNFHSFRMRYGHCYICATCATMSEVAETYVYKWKLSEICFSNCTYLFGEEK